MTRIMYDGIASDAAAIPATAQLVAGYVDGRYAWSAADWARFPHAVHVPIAVHPGTNAGTVLDVENGNATAAQSVDWVLMRRAAGCDPTAYCNEQDRATGWPAVHAAFAARGVPEPHYWVANYDGVQAVPAGAVAKQYASTDRWDLSVVADYWPGVDPAPTPTPAPPAPDSSEDDMALSTTSLGGRAGLSWAAGTRHVVQVTYDPAGGDLRLRLVLALVGGPWVAPTLAPVHGSGNFEIPANMISECRGAYMTLEPGSPQAVYDVCAV